MLQLPASVSGFEDLYEIEAPLYLGIGVFDGLHRGHKAVVKSAVSAAKAAGGLSGVLTFDPHPSRLFRPETATRLILPISRKVELLHGIGVQVVIGKQFDTNFAAIEAEIRSRDELDAGRAIGPLMCPDGAIEVDERLLVVAEVSFEIGELTQDMSWGGGVLGFLQQRQGLEEGLSCRLRLAGAVQDVCEGA